MRDSRKTEILFADDDEELATLIEFLLEQPGMSVKTAQNVSEIVQAVEAVPPVLVLMDWSVSGLDGIVGSRQIKGVLGLPQEIVLLLSAGILRQDYPIRKGHYRRTSDPALAQSFLIEQVRRRLPQPVS